MFSQPDEDFCCPICQSIFRDPVVLLCSHSFCRDCLQSWWTEKQIRLCPLCKVVAVLSDPPRNLALKNLCEAFVMERDRRSSGESEALCSLHTEKLKLFCLDHQEPVCLVCRDSRMHNDHKFIPIDEAANEHREELQKSLKPVQDKLKTFEQVKGSSDKTADYIKVQATITERRIKEQFKKLHKFLEEDEEARICALRDEEEKKSCVMKEKIDALNTEIAALSETIRVTEDVLRAEDVSFLQNYKTAVRRVQQHPLLEDPELVSGALIDQAKHLGNLSFNIWNKMKKMVSYSPMVLDPNSAHPDLVLSEDLTCVRFGKRQKLPENPERFGFHRFVQGSEGFDSGTHGWDVEVINGKFWGIGVVQESVEKKGKILSDCLALVYSEGKYWKCSPPRSHRVLYVKTKPQRIRVHLDYDRGKLSFSDSDTNTLLLTFTHTFTERLFPYVRTLDELPLRISPVTVSVQVDQPITPFSGLWSSLFMP